MNIMLGKIDFLESKHQAEVVKSILKILKTVDKEKTPSAYNNIVRILKNSVKSLKSFEKTYKEKVVLK